MVEKKCDICGKKFSSSKGIKIHKSRKHKSVEKRIEDEEKKEDEKEYKGNLDKVGKSEDEKKKEERMEKQFKVILGVMLAAILGFLLIFFIMQAGSDITYRGMDFEKRDVGDITYYDTQFQILSRDGEIRNLDFSFRNHPKELDKIPIEGDLDLEVLEENVGISIEDKVVCEYNSVALLGLTMNFFDRLRMDIFKGNIDKDLAEEENETHLVCDNDKYSVLNFREGDETKIVREDNCYHLHVSDCEILEVSERFMLGWYYEYREEYLEN